MQNKILNVSYYSIYEKRLFALSCKYIIIDSPPVSVANGLLVDWPKCCRPDEENNKFIR